ncbi:SLATT domain-containing protein [Clostridium vitabionis]|uniref:SLATT domain-containing protein n=1 Tax=Clostridium vitabionis TaxID=2784388 RepID=UPI00188CCC13|nr:SLATT domain-containing protein [Clostridium vitabionis]
MNNNNQILLEEIRQNYASVVWTHKIQEKQADIYAKRYRVLETINILMAAATSCGIITTIFLDSMTTKVITAILSFGTLAITAYFKSFDVKSMEQQHRIAANSFIVIRERLLHVIASLHMNDEIDGIRRDYNDIMKDLNKLYISAPSTTDAAVKLADKALKVKGEYTYTQEEIDRFLPPALRGGIS